MPTRRTFIVRALALLAAAAGLSRLAGGAAGAKESAWCKKPFPGLYICDAINVLSGEEFRGGKCYRMYRTWLINEAGYVAKIGPERWFEVSPELPEAP